MTFNVQFQENYGLTFKAAMAVNWFFMLNHTRRSCDSLNDKRTKKLTEFANRIRHSSALVYPTINAEFCDDLCKFLDYYYYYYYTLSYNHNSLSSLNKFVPIFVTKCANSHFKRPAHCTFFHSIFANCWSNL